MDRLSSQPRDILYLIISFLAYTPDTAALGRTSQTLDRVPQWYERSGHHQPHNEYEVGQSGEFVRYVDRKPKEWLYADYSTPFLQCIRRPYITHCVNSKGRLIKQDLWSKDCQHKTTIQMRKDGTVVYFCVISGKTTYSLSISRETKIVRCCHTYNSAPTIRTSLTFNLDTGRMLSCDGAYDFPHLPTLFDFDWGVFR
jgi:hypothetical protein